jgi:hypothetical protein
MYIVTAAQLRNKEEQAHCAAEPSGLSHDYNTLCVGSLNLAFSTTWYLKKKKAVILLQFQETIMSSKHKQN